MERQAELARLAERQIFFIGGAPRSGTTWLQQILHAHPDISCQGEGLFMQQLADPLGRMMAQRSKALADKNTGLFSHTGGYPLPLAEDTEHLIGTAILLALLQQAAAKPCQALGEKTPENVFFFPRLHAMFPAAKFIALARDPRDVIVSAWHFFRPAEAARNDPAEKLAFIRLAMPSIGDGARTMIRFVAAHPDHCAMVTYEELRRTPKQSVTRLFKFLGVPHRKELVQDCLARTDFSAATGGRPAGVEQNGSFFRKGEAGGWRSILTPEMNNLVLRELGWMFPHFGWQA